MPLIETVSDTVQGRDVLRRRRYGVIAAEQGRVTGIRLRPWPQITTAAGLLWAGHQHRSAPGDFCRLYYNQPLWHSNFLSITLLVSSRDCALRTVYAALRALDQIAALKRTDAILCEAWNLRLSDRLLARHGWEPHTPSRWHRHFIKRFYGQYPQHAAGLKISEQMS